MVFTSNRITTFLYNHVSPQPLEITADRRWNEASWYALHTRSRHEKLVDFELRKKGIETFFPIRCITRHWSDRRKVVELPLFPGYLFICIPLKNRLAVLNTTGVSRFVGPYHSKPTEIPNEEILSVRRFADEKIPLDPFPYLKEGERVYVRAGSFKGVEGFIIRKDKHCRLIVSLHLLMQSVSVEIDASCVEPI